ncbi:NlpC/P60 family protein [Photobacterium sp. TY1-4]|uniref:NlpC/P60 family protein n=1 Tax=Photobacterium sp. TY1-4 TaxID=2899122 RepID=UPI0021BF1E36|nr:NlpC/P60 family protein [Photobacterium sp. TY1-4]UXI04381.1 NlpC/P60 family protein [Photobacterium sp. TY1-4]
MINHNFPRSWLGTGLLLLGLSGCATSPEHEAGTAPASEAMQASAPAPFQPVPMQFNPNQPTFDLVYQSWKGTPYRLGGSSRRGIDCSAFVQVGYQEVFDRILPRTTLEQVRQGRQVPLHQARKGDLVFFKTGRTLRHVGIYLGNREFLHASTSQGVVISTLDTPYWRRAFWQVRRIE